MADKTPGPREQQLRELREARVAKNKALIDKESKLARATKASAKVIGKVARFKAKKTGGRGR